MNGEVFVRIKAALVIVWASLRAQRSYLRGNWLEYAIVTLAFIVVTLIFTNFVLLNGDHQLFIEGPGDGTAGFLWFNYVDHDASPLLGHTDFINYPTGDSLGNPVYVTYSVHIVALWTLTKVFGPILAINIWTFIGFLSCAIAMYWLIKKLTNNIYASLFAAFAATYIPYHIINSTSHISYIFSALFVLLFAASYGFWKKPTIKRALILAGVLAASYYTDGYFILIGTVEVVALIACFMIHDALFQRKGYWRRIWQRVRFGLVAAAAAAVMIAPIAYVQLSQASTISNNFSNARTDIKFEMDYYSVKLMDFIVPSVHNPFLIKDSTFREIQHYKNSRSNSTENSLYIGFTVLLFDVMAFAFLITYILNKKRSSLSALPVNAQKTFRLATFAALAGAAMLFAWMLPRSFYLFGHHIPTPAGILADSGVSLWRVLARFFLPMHVLLVIAAALGLSILLAAIGSRLKRKRATFVGLAMLVVLIIAMTCEYASLTSRPSYDFKNIPMAYYWLKDRTDINVVAELPLVDRPLETNYNYATAQIVHGKKLVNDHLLSLPIGYRNALGDIDNRESVDYAIKRHAQAIITHSHSCVAKTDWGQLVYKDENKQKTKESAYYGSPICIYKVTIAEGLLDGVFPVLERGTFADMPLVTKKLVYNRVYGEKGVVLARDAYGNNVTGSAVLKAKTSITPGSSIPGGGMWRIVQDGTVKGSGKVGGEINARVDLSRPVNVWVTWNNHAYKDTLYAFSMLNVSLNRY